MTADAEASSDTSPSEDTDSRRDKLARAIEEFNKGEIPTEDEVSEAFLS